MGVVCVVVFMLGDVCFILGRVVELGGKFGVKIWYGGVDVYL